MYLRALPTLSVLALTAIVLSSTGDGLPSPAKTQNYFYDISETLRSLKSSNNKYLFDDRLVDGYVPNNVSCIRCAVIGNGGILRGSGIGREIDAHDYVFRVNVALTKGYEEDVGTKTSFYCFSMVTLSNSLRGGGPLGFRTPPYQKGIRYVFFADNEWTYQYLSAVLNNRPAPQSADRFKSWVNSTSQHKTVHRPTTGAIMLLLALHTCDEVNVYGFAGSYSKFSEHYYDKKFQKHIFFANHDSNKENALWRQLDQLGIINLYTRQ